MNAFLGSLAALATVAVFASHAAAADPPGGARLLAKLPGPAGTDVAFSRDGKLLLTAGGDEARVWDADTYKPVTEPLKHTDGEKLSLANLSPDGKLVLTVVGSDAWVWDATSGERLSVLRHGGTVRSASFNPAGTKVITAGGTTTARVWDAADGAEVLAIRHPEPVFNAEWSPDGSKILTVAKGPGVDVEFNYLHARAYVWEADGGRQLLRKAVDDFPYDGEETHLRPAAWSGDGRLFACVVFKGVTVWDVETGRAVSSPTTWGDLARTEVGTPAGLALNRDGSLLATYNAGGVALWDTTKRDRLLATFAERESVRKVGFGPDGRRFFVSAETGGDSGGVWDATSRRQVLAIRAQRGTPGPAPAIAFSPNGKRVAAGFASDGLTGVWKVPDPKQP